MRVLIVLCVLLAGCSSAQPRAIGGDRAAGVIRYEIRNVSLRTRVDAETWASAEADALKRCRAWGYESATSFDVRCQQPSLRGGCADELVRREYQCVD